MNSGRGLQIAVPATGVMVGLLLIAGPFFATVIRSALVWGPDDVVAVSVGNFVNLFADPRFWSAALNTVIAGSFTESTR